MAVVHLTKEDFEEKTKTGWSMVDFWAEWCGPCKMAAPVIEELATEYDGKVLVAKVDVDAHAELAGKFSVMSIPTVILLRDGKEVARQVGFAGRAGYVQLLTKAGVA
ncbi:thioredoxin [Candidatus Amesbacteria bacterium RIFCSPHIGHO2_02_FULL_48_21]|uniref:Thioredoxin n=3 Tax=Candidatus Amesiibacteriota TaxID=1752730 RepID=A0A1F4ZE98_9BACT|nr:MAG: Thioredoxin [Candidatus Amesbacteria bacterium GW2011_GWA1_48_9]OGC90917.1 MAG: thioredoxin [Candidatus Amesbacteria bacterium RBG_19FT_COMBO_48_16]OGC96762.1 MAG: thioredoxin [Candidatus Amesbacteria bacterium RIFCSPHIGHO2_02_FULL_48_21]OGC97395.1 MAG: thioredoxin [Candidatus Amesbacteria bacterium RBG_16_48_31]OGD03977.1 MAG: thioredoxin [Candidatus Amesbacteria bacterium RIFCSPHIGHO2_12_FULL_48_14]